MPHASLCNIFSKVQLVLGTSKHSINKLHSSIGAVPLVLLKDSIQCPYGTFRSGKQFLTSWSTAFRRELYYSCSGPGFGLVGDTRRESVCSCGHLVSMLIFNRGFVRV